MSALSRTCRDTASPQVREVPGGQAAVWLWPGRALYAGPSLRLGPHSGAVACVAVGVDAPFTVRRTSGELRARTALIPPRVRHHLIAGGERMVFLYLDPGSAEDRACRARFAAGDHGVLTGHESEAGLLVRAAAISAHSPDQEITDWTAEATGHEAASFTDPRIAAAMCRLIGADQPLPAALLAAELGLSESRFLRLFSDRTGTSYRRFRLWAQMHRAARALAEGANLTRAAADGYFASPSHFSTAFHAMFGLPPSALLSRSLTIRCLDPVGLTR
ncbi:helix-turn-helix domain-containing protein [Nonomuraea sp. NPDC046802]|uniref:helix-turn-helix domain-containing protein n=1 Tax=Nonomuraea sp. NPDC046802 TaxID=3154919 RepID=UPI003411A5E5